jgi:hypothetical protein
MIKTFRGLLAGDEQVTIRLGTNQGLIGYKITKFQVMPYDVDGSDSHETSVKIFKYKQTTFNPDIDFNDPTMLAAAYYVRSLNTAAPYVALISEQSVIFDNVKFNQDIYVSMATGQSGTKINYYLELEQVKLTVDEAAVATLKDIRK